MTYRTGHRSEELRSNLVGSQPSTVQAFPCWCLVKTNHKFSSTSFQEPGVIKVVWTAEAVDSCRTPGYWPQWAHFRRGTTVFSPPHPLSHTEAKFKTQKNKVGCLWFFLINRKSDNKKICNNLQHSLLTTFLNPFYFKSTPNRQHPSSVTIRNGTQCDSIPNQDNPSSIFQNFIGFYPWKSPVS